MRLAFSLRKITDKNLPFFQESPSEEKRLEFSERVGYELQLGLFEASTESARAHD